MYVYVAAAEKPLTPSNVTAVIAGAMVTLPVPAQVPEMVIGFEYPLATRARNALCRGKLTVDGTGAAAAGASPPPPPPHAVRNAVDKARVNNVVYFIVK